MRTIDIRNAISSGRFAEQIFLFLVRYVFFLFFFFFFKKFRRVTRTVPTEGEKGRIRERERVTLHAQYPPVMIYQSAIYGGAVSSISNGLFLLPAADRLGIGKIWLRSANESEIYNGISRTSR